MFVIIRIYFRQIASYLVWLSLHKLFFLFNFNLFDPLLSETGKQVFFRPIKIWALVQHGSGRSSKQDCKRFLELHKWASMAHKVLHFFVTFSAWSACQVSDFCLLKILRDRAMDFLVELFRNLLEHPDWTMSQACTDSYTKTLKKFHGWLASSSFTVESFTLWWSIQSVEFYPHLVNCNLTVLAQEIIINIWFLEMWGLFFNWIVNLLGIRAW